MRPCPSSARLTRVLGHREEAQKERKKLEAQAVFEAGKNRYLQDTLEKEIVRGKVPIHHDVSPRHRSPHVLAAEREIDI